MTTTQLPTVLIVDDTRPFIEMVSEWLSGEYTVLTAYSGTQAIAAVDDEVDVILVDRRMPGLSGDELLGRLREQGTDVVIAFLTVVEPTSDIIDLPVEGYIQKPVSSEELREAVAELVRQRSYHRSVRRLYSVTQKRELLEKTMNREILSRDDNYIALREEETRLTEQLADITDQFSEEGFEAALQIAASGGL